MKGFFSYLLYIFKNVFMLACLILDVGGIVVSLVGQINIPPYIYFLVLAVGFLISNYRLYKENISGVNINISPLRNYPLQSKDFSKMGIELIAFYNLYLENKGSNTSYIEDIQTILIGFCDKKGRLVKRNISVSFVTYFIAETEEIDQSHDYIKPKEATNFPVKIEANASSRKVLVVSFKLSGQTRKEYEQLLHWADDFKILVTSFVKNNGRETEIYKTAVLRGESIMDFLNEKEFSRSAHDEQFNEHK